MTIAQALSLHPDAGILLVHVLNSVVSRFIGSQADKSANYNLAFLFANPEQRLSKSQETKFKKLLAARRRGVPAAYLTGRKEFFGLDFLVNKNVLIPRPETELLVELALQKIFSPSRREGGDEEGVRVVDVGTGSGNIIISIAKKLPGFSGLVHHTPQLYATDSSPKVLNIAAQNARRHGVARKIKFLRGDLLDPLFGGGLKASVTSSTGVTETFRFPVLIIANLPYLTPRQLRQNPDLRHEPRSALVAGPDGLKYYRELFRQLSAFSPSRREGGDEEGVRSLTLLLEHDPRQKIKLGQLARRYFGKLPQIRFHRDLAGRYRVIEITL